MYVRDFDFDAENTESNLAHAFDENDLQEDYDNFLNETSGEIVIAGIEFDPARILETLDPIAYRTGFNDWLDAELSDGSSFIEIDEEGNRIDY